MCWRVERRLACSREVQRRKVEEVSVWVPMGKSVRRLVRTAGARVPRKAHTYTHIQQTQKLSGIKPGKGSLNRRLERGLERHHSMAGDLVAAGERVPALMWV